MSSSTDETDYNLKILILIISSGTLSLFSLPQLSIGVYKICKLRKLNLPKAILWSSLLSLFAAYLVMLTILILSIFANSLDHINSSPIQDNGGKPDDLYLNSNRDNIPLLLSVGVSLVEFLFIISKFGVNFLFLCRLYYSFKDTLFHYTIYKLLPLFILIIIELVIYILFSEIIIVHFVNDYQFKKLNKIFLSSYHCIDMIVRISFILLFERGLYRLATSRSFKSNLRLFGFGGASIDQIELSCKPTQNSSENKSISPKMLKDQVHVHKTEHELHDNSSNHNMSDLNNYLHPLQYQNTDRAENNNKFSLSNEAIPEGNECETEVEVEESIELHDIDIDIDADFNFLDEDEQPHMHNIDHDHMDNTTPTNVTNVSNLSFQSLHSQTNTSIKQHKTDENDQELNANKLELPPCIDEGNELNELNMDVLIHNAFQPSKGNEKEENKNNINEIADVANIPNATSPQSMSLATLPTIHTHTHTRTPTNSELFVHRNSTHSRKTSQINDLLSMSQMSHHKKRSSFAMTAMKYFNDSTFDSHTKDLVYLVTKFSVLVVWSTITSIFAAVFFISFVIDFNDNQILTNISSSYIALIICFVEMHIVYLQLNGTEKWYKCLCSLCHSSWGKCCVCKLRRRLVRKIGKQHKALTIEKQNHSNNTSNTLKLKN